MLLLSVNRYDIFLSTCPLQSLELHCWRKNNSRRKSFCLLDAPMYQKPQFSAPHFPSHFTEYSPISSFMLIAAAGKPVSITSPPREPTISLNLLLLACTIIGSKQGTKKKKRSPMTTCGKWSKDIFHKRNPCYQESSKWCGRMKYRTTTQTTVMTNASIGNQGSTQWAGNQRPGNRGSGVGLMMHRAQCETAFTKINQNFWHLRKLTLYWDEWALQLFSANRSKLRQHFCERTFSCQDLQ